MSVVISAFSSRSTMPCSYAQPVVVNARLSSWSVSNASAVTIALSVALDRLLSFRAVAGELAIASQGQERPIVMVEVEECYRPRVRYAEGGRTKMMATKGKGEFKFP